MAEKESCVVCTKAVYPTERLAADERVYHKSCFRCKKCNNVLKLGNYASMEGMVFCKPCFKKNFFSKGNYSEGFGKLKPQQEHDLKTGKVTDGFGMSTTPSEASPPVNRQDSNPDIEPSKPVERQLPPKPAPKVEEPKPKVEEPKPKVEEPKPIQRQESKPKVEEAPKPKVEEHSKPKVEEPKPKVEEPKPIQRQESKPKVEEAPKPIQRQESKGVDAPATAGSSGTKFHGCAKTVYKMEETRADDLLFHKSCFRCKQCNNVLKLGSYASMQSVFFCKPCFKKLFLSKGNYSEGFGKLKPQQEHDLKSGKVAEGEKPQEDDNKKREEELARQKEEERQKALEEARAKREEADRRKREQDEAERKKREHDDAERKKKEQEEADRKKKEQEAERKRQEEADRKKKEQEEEVRKKKEALAEVAKHKEEERQKALHEAQVKKEHVDHDSSLADRLAAVEQELKEERDKLAQLSHKYQTLESEHKEALSEITKLKAENKQLQQELASKSTAVEPKQVPESTSPTGDEKPLFTEEETPKKKGLFDDVQDVGSWVPSGKKSSLFDD